MSKRAKEIALKAYPIHKIHRGLDADNEIYDSNAELRRGCIRGYEQAENNLAPTWEDIREILRVQAFVSARQQAPVFGSREYYQEILEEYRKWKRKR